MSVEPNREYWYRDIRVTASFHDVQEERCLILDRTTRAGVQCIWGITLAKAWELNDPETCYHRAREACTQLRLDPDKPRHVCRIIDVFDEQLDDLVRQPPPKIKSTAELIEHAVEHEGLRIQRHGETVVGEDA